MRLNRENNRRVMSLETSKVSSQRNSSIELLRIISMFIILAHHFAVHNSYDYTQMAVGLTRFLIQAFLESGGKVGVVIFFTISAWFLCEQRQTVRGCFRRVWFLEKEVLFYSILMAAVCLAMGLVGPRLAVRSLFPLTLEVWWYPTAYATFLLFLPFLERGLIAVGRTSHLALCGILLFLYGILSFLPDAQMVSGVYGLVYLFVLISAYRWYLEDSHPLTPIPMIVAGTGMIIAYAAFALIAFQFRGTQIGIPQGDVLTREMRLPAVLIGIGLFLLFKRRDFRSRIVNICASGAFSVYLITDYPAIQKVIWSGPMDLRAIGDMVAGPAWAFSVLLVIYVACTAFDLLRSRIFRFTVDRIWDKLFQILWAKICGIFQKIFVRLG